MPFSHIVGGMTFTDANFLGNAYADEQAGFPMMLEKMVEHVANAYHGASSDPLTVGAGAKALTIANSSGQIPAFSVGMPVRIARTADPAGVWMQGEITAWDGATGIATVNIDATKGSGSFSDWSIAIGGHLSTASGTPPLAVSQGGTGASSGKAALANLTPSVAGIIETNANFVDAVIFGPALDPVDWSPRTAAPTSSLMLATVEDAGADAEVNIWDLTDDTLTGMTPLATVTLVGVAAVTSIAAVMGYITIGTNGNGMKMIDPHDGSWAERTVGHPKSLYISGWPTANHANVIGVAAGLYEGAPIDPRTGGPMPAFAQKYGGGTYGITLYKLGKLHYIGNAAATSDAGIAIAADRVWFTYSSGELRQAGPIAGIAGNQTVNPPYLAADSSGNEPYNIAADADAIDGYGDLVAIASGEGLGLNRGFSRTVSSSAADDPASNASITRTYNTGYSPYWQKAIWLANSKTADRTALANNLTENGTVTEAAVESGAELMGYSGWSSSNYLDRAHDTDFDFGTGVFSFMLWVKSPNVTTGEALMVYGSSSSPWIGLQWTSGGIPQFECQDGAGGLGVAAINGLQAHDDGAWHFIVGLVGEDDYQRLYVDGVEVASQDASARNNMTNSSATTKIGAYEGGSAAATSSTISLARISKSAPSAAQIRQIYEAERPMFAANAKCLLQSSSTDAVLDVSVDPITGKVAVTQWDAAMIFDGLVVVSEPTIATGGTAWERTLLYGGDRVEINDANLYAAIAAKDLRGELDALRGLKAGLPAGVDLSKAKAWCVLDGTGTKTIISSHNIKSITYNGTGDYVFEFGVPFKANANSGNTPSYAAFAGSEQPNARFIGGSGSTSRHQARIIVTNSSESVTDDNMLMLVCFGELENE